MKIKYSIIIPTKNGIDYLPSAISSVLDNERSDVELIVSDNFSTDGTREFLLGLNDSRVRIVMPPSPLPMSGNYEFALAQAKGEWVTIIGDDDAVMPYIFDELDGYCLEFPKINIISSSRAYYFWAGDEKKYGKAVVSYNCTYEKKIRSTKKDLFFALAGIISCYDMPQIYTSCIVRRKAIDSIKQKSGGCFYHSIIPDMYSVVALCIEEEEYLRINKPLFWVGTSNKSMGRSDRVYKDSSRVSQDRECSIVGISNNVSYKLHSSGFSSMYLYEALLQSPRKIFFNEKILKIIVLASLAFDIKKRTRLNGENINSDLLIFELKKECKKYNIPIVVVVATKYLLTLIKLTIRVVKKQIFFIKTLFNKNYRTKKLRSDDRNIYPTIMEAFNAIKKL
jgi:glycosyltransferase involved in cell wall biosynthesis